MWIVQAFETLQLLRERNPALYQSAGLLTNTEEWVAVRRGVQQDMMRPSSALHYITEIEEVATELADRIWLERDEAGATVVNTLCNKALISTHYITILSFDLILQ